VLRALRGEASLLNDLNAHKIRTADRSRP
jgi:hypothetical protein